VNESRTVELSDNKTRYLNGSAGEALEAPFILTFQGINVPQQNTIYYIGNDLRRGVELPTLTPCSPPPWLLSQVRTAGGGVQTTGSVIGNKERI
jgi:hypothetical protein